jgi:hypothetical protein
VWVGVGVGWCRCGLVLVWVGVGVGGDVGSMSMSVTVSVLSSLRTALNPQRPFLAGFGPPFLLWEMSTPLLNMHWFMVRLLRAQSLHISRRSIARCCFRSPTALFWHEHQSHPA